MSLFSLSIIIIFQYCSYLTQEKKNLKKIKFFPIDSNTGFQILRKKNSKKRVRGGRKNTNNTRTGHIQKKNRDDEIGLSGGGGNLKREKE